MNRMSKFVCCLAVVALLAIAQPTQADDIAWQAKFDKALKTAGEKQQPVLVFATMRGCHFCNKMHHESYSNKTVAAELNRDFVPVWLDAGRSRAVLERLGVEYYPTTLIYSSQGKLIDKLEGYEPTQKLRSAMQGALKNRATVKVAAAVVLKDTTKDD
jgi:thioredoxin-related protein